MERKPNNSGPSFFKVLIRDDFTTRLRLPNVFVHNYGRLVGENVRLRSSWGQIWDVNVVEEDGDNDEEDDDNCRWFSGEGWTKFVKDCDIKLEEFLVFSLHTPAPSITIFDVSVYGTNCCLRPISDMPQHFHSTNNYHTVPDTDVIKKRGSEGGKHGRKSKLEDKNSPLYFEIVLKQHHRSRISLPKRFRMATGLMKAAEVGLEYIENQYYKCVKLDRHSHRRSRVDMSIGWSEFRKANGLAYGKTYSFVFKPIKKLIQVKEIHN